MPHPNRYQSSSKLRLPPSQTLDTQLPLHPKSMPSSESFLSNASIRRLSSSRRARPIPTSIADIFVRSLVMAGYCQKHSPRGRSMATVSINAVKNNAVKMESRGITRATRQLPSKTQLDYLSSRAECLGVHCLGTQRMFNSSVAQRVDDYNCEDERIATTSIEESTHRSSNPGMKLNYTLKEELPPRPHTKLDPDRTIDNTFFTDKTHRAPINNEEQSILNRQRTFPELERYRHYVSPRAELYEYTSKLYQSALGSNLDWKQAADAIISPPTPTKQCDNTRNAIELQSVQKFLEAMWDKSKSNHYVFGLYRELPHPGISCLSKRTRGALLRRFAHPRDRRWVDARRYLALVEDMLSAGLPISRSLWTTAIHLAGRATGKVRKSDLVRAIGLWQQMEHIAGIKSDGVVFGILFDIAIKAGQFTVADRLMVEMEKRDIHFDRPGKVTKMYYYGMLRNPEGIRRTFNEFVGAGEIVDTAVLNCLMASFLRSGETKMAEQLYQRMMQAQASSQETLECTKSKSPRLYVPGLTSDLVLYRKRSKKLNRLLQLSASLKDSLPEHHQALQDAFPMAPDTRTFHIFLCHHAYQTGNLDAFMSVLEDMERTFTVPPRGMVYLLLFEGFAHHGRRKKGWTAEKLRATWKTYLRALYESKTRLHSRTYSQPITLVWENPLAEFTSSGPARSSLVQSNPSSGLYTPLPSIIQGSRDQSHDGQEEDVAQFHEDDESAGIDVDDILDQRKQDHQLEIDELELMERRIDNGVFLGRRMIMIILRAFGSCCGPNEVMEVWLRMESIWQPEKRKGLDVLAVKEELEKQMNKAR